MTQPPKAAAVRLVRAARQAATRAVQEGPGARVARAAVLGAREALEVREVLGMRELPVFQARRGSQGQAAAQGPVEESEGLRATQERRA